MKLASRILFCLYLTSWNVSAQVDNALRHTETPGCGYQDSPENMQLRKRLVNKLYREDGTGKIYRGTAEKYKIPVVFHLIEPDPKQTIAGDEWAQVAIKNLNDAFRGAGMFEGSLDTGIEFELARYDPDCNETSGITRTDASHFSTYPQTGIVYQTSCYIAEHR